MITRIPILLTLSLLLLAFGESQGQELQVEVSVVTAPQVQLTDPQVFQSLEQAIRDFMNNQRWTNDEYEQFEKIDLSIVLTITEDNGSNSFKAELALQSLRPVYGSTYKTPMLNQIDKNILFQYEQFQPIEFVENAFTDNLSAILSFYAYVVLGLDYDSFSPFGGEKYFQKAQDIVNLVPESLTTTYLGWRPKDGNRNRYWLVENLLSPKVRPFRQAWYDYHRQGLDIAYSNVAAARAIVMQALEDIQKVNQVYPQSMIVQLFTNAKADEIIELFKPAPVTDRNKVIQIMSRLDPSRSTKYRVLR
ncbi:MAG TPA: DUF4835 family protein [Phaeodactylibacter sp.]|nr:DUF4835 family protein [Phaeodactylibacter sp.]